MITGYERNEENIIKDGARKDRFHSLAPGRTVIRVLPPYSKRGVWFKSILEGCPILSPSTERSSSPVATSDWQSALGISARGGGTS